MVIPTFNAENNISQLCKELIKTFDNFKIQIVIVNDCSEDNTHEECLKLIKDYSNELAYIKLGKNMSEILKGVFAASMSVLKADLSLDIEKTLYHAKKNLDEHGVGSAFFGSTGCGQLISISENSI